jgi:hypothetical protein
MKRFKAVLTVGILAGGMTMVYLRPATTAAVAPLMGMVVAYWFRGQTDELPRGTGTSAAGR